MTCRQAKYWTLQCAAIFAALLLCGPLNAQDVTVTSHGGNLTLTGRVIGFDGSYMQIESQYGPLTLDYDRVTCSGVACPDRDAYVPTLRLSGAARMADVLLPALIDGFARSQGYLAQFSPGEPGWQDITLTADGATVARFTLHGTTSEEGFADLITFQSDMALSLREVRPKERERAAEAGLGALDAPGQSRIIGLDALVPVVGAGQSIRAVTLQDLAAILSGKTQSWAELGGDDAPIALHLGPSNDGQMQFLETALGAASRPDAIRHPTFADMSAAVARDPMAFGIGDLGAIGGAQAISLTDDCGFVAVPRRTALKAQDYPLTAPLFIYLPEWRLHPVAHQFLAFTRSPAAQLIVRRAGFIDQGAVPVPLDAQGQRFASAIASAGPEVSLDELKRMVRILTALTRQSVSFRFEVGSTRLDANSRSNLLLLAQAIRDGAFDDRALWLIGFSDGRGDAAANRDLSSARAEAVKRDLIEVLRDVPDTVTLETEAFGEALPMGCDDTEWGRQINRRVELWVSE